MNLLAILNPGFVLRRSFPDHVVGYDKVSSSGSPKSYTVGYNLIANDKLLNAVTIFGYRRERSLIDEFTLSKSVGISGDDFKHVGEKTLKIQTLDGTHSALMNVNLVTLQFDNAKQRVGSILYLFEVGSKFIRFAAPSQPLKRNLPPPRSMSWQAV